MAAVKTPTPNMERAMAAWGKRSPDWIAALAAECDRSSQGKVAGRLNISSAVVNQVLGNTYTGRVDRVEARVRGELLNAKVLCPILAEISKRECLDNQRLKFTGTNPLRVRLFVACKTCPNREDACSSK